VPVWGHEALHQNESLGDLAVGARFLGAGLKMAPTRAIPLTLSERALIRRAKSRHSWKCARVG
jgi:hypothetical protein